MQTKYVLVVDDDEQLRRAWWRYFKVHEWEWVVDIAATVNGALIALCSPGRYYDLIISDFDLCDTEGNGVDVLILARGEQSSARRIMCSGNEKSEQPIKDALKFGTIESFLPKPLDPSLADKTIGRLLV